MGDLAKGAVEVEQAIAELQRNQAALRQEVEKASAVVSEMQESLAGIQDALENIDKPGPVDPPVDPPKPDCGPMPDIVRVPDGKAGVKNGLIYDFDFEDGRVPGRNQPNQSAKLSRKLVAPGSCTSLLMDRLASESVGTGRRAENVRSEVVFFGDGSNLDISRMQWGKSYWFRWKFAIGEGWKYRPDDKDYEIVMQLHDSSAGNGGPSVNLSATIPNHRRRPEWDGKWLFEGRALPQSIPLDPVTPGEFNECIMHVVPDKRGGKDGGLLQFWWNGEQVCDVRNKQTFRDKNRDSHETAPGAPIEYGPYAKFGIYHSEKSLNVSREVFFDRLTVWGGEQSLYDVKKAWDKPASRT